MSDSSKGIFETLDEPYISVESLMEIDFGDKEVEPLPETMSIWDMTNVTKTWKDEDWDELIPKDGFIYDFVLAHRGYASPTAYWLWSAIMAMSTMLGRDAWMEWADGKLFANFYALLVGPAGVVKKSTALNKALEVIQEYIDVIPNEAIAFQKRTPSILGKSSEASLYMVMENQKQTVLSEMGDSITIESDGKIFCCINELATFLSKASYSSGLVEKLTDMYDCKNRDSEATRSRGMSSLKNIYSTFFGATTPDGLRDSIPESAFGGGFMSRLLTVYVHTPTRIYSKPIKMVGTPKLEDLKQRLAWLALRARGEYDLSPRAFDHYDSWYHQWFADRIAEPDDRSLSNRQDVITLKLATILCAQRYNHPLGMDQVVTLSDYKLAEKIIDKTLKSGVVAMDKVGQNNFFIVVDKVKSAIKTYMKKNGGNGVPRAYLTRKMSSKKINTKAVNEALDQLNSMDILEIKTKTGTVIMDYQKATNETYSIIEGV